MELHVCTRGTLLPNPEFDAIEAFFYCITNDVPFESPVPDMLIGAIVLNSAGSAYSNKKNDFLERCGVTNCNVISVDSEEALLIQVVSLVREWDPDILVGYEVNKVK